MKKFSIIFRDNATKIIFQCDYFVKTIFSEHLEKENIVFCAVLYPPTKESLLKYFVDFTEKYVKFSKIKPSSNV